MDDIPFPGVPLPVGAEAVSVAYPSLEFIFGIPRKKFRDCDAPISEAQDVLYLPRPFLCDFSSIIKHKKSSLIITHKKNVIRCDCLSWSGFSVFLFPVHPEVSMWNWNALLIRFAASVFLWRNTSLAKWGVSLPGS